MTFVITLDNFYNTILSLYLIAKYDDIIILNCYYMQWKLFVWGIYASSNINYKQWSKNRRVIVADTYDQDYIDFTTFLLPE
jgi:hypothetical protein